MADEGKTYGVGGRSGRFRTLIIFGVAMVLVISVMGYVYYVRSSSDGIESKAILSKPPTIQSVPGEATTPEYARTVEQENARQAEEAAQKGTSSIATIVRPSFSGGGEFESADNAKPGCSKEDLAKARAAGVKAEELKCRGCSAKDLRDAGYTAAELLAAGFTPTDLRAAGFTADELRAAGVSAAEMRKAGYTVDQLAKAGYTVCQLVAAGTKPEELQSAGFTGQQMAEAGIGYKPTQGLPTNCDPQGLVRAKRAGISAAELRSLNCGAGALRIAGYSARELRAACYSAAELKAAGFTAAELKDAGFTAAELREAGFTAKELKDAGFSAAELRAAGYTATQLRAAGFTPDELKKAGFTDGELQRAGFTAAELGGAAAAAALGLDEASLMAAKAALSNACSEISLRKAKEQGVSGEALKQLNCSVAQLRNAGFTAAELRAAGYTAAELRAAGFSAAELRAAGFTASELAAAGFTPAELAAAGYSPMEIANAGFIGGSGAKLDASEFGLSPEQRRQLLEKTVSNMGTSANLMLSTWVPPPTQAYVAAIVSKEKIDTDEGGTGRRGEGQGQGQGSSGAGGTVAKKKVGTVIKAGTVMYATLDTGINSDEKSPILATIVAGELKGARLIGEFALVGETVVVTFTKINIPQLATSAPCKAFAIDPDTARTALAHNVDNHYMLRYGSLFASSFVSGFAEAVTSSGSQTSSGAGGLLTTRAPLTIGEQIATAIGAVGTAYAQIMGANFQTPPTVTVEGGASIGVLLNDDLTLPEKI